MLKLSAVTLVALYATLVIWGEPIESDVAVTRADTASSAPLLAGFSASRPADAAANRLSEAEAVQAALAAGEVERASRPADTAPAVEEEEAPEVWYVTGSRVNLRAGPSTGNAIVGQVGLGETAELLSDPSEPWLRIRTEDGQEAWIYGRFLSETPA